MAKKQSKTSYKKGRMSLVIQGICDQYKLDPKEMNAYLHINFPSLFNKMKCANCEAGMVEYLYHTGILDVQLLEIMTKSIDDSMKKGRTFTEANKIKLAESDIKKKIWCRTNISSKLGLIAKVIDKKEGSKDKQRQGCWTITTRGFELLSGKPVPAVVKVFRNKIIERYDDMIDIRGIYARGTMKFSENEICSKISQYAGVVACGYQGQGLF